MDIGNLIKRTRKERKLSQVELSIETGIAQSMISEYEKGRVIPTIEQLMKIARALRTDLNHLVGFTPVYDSKSEEIARLVSAYQNGDTDTAIAIVIEDLKRQAKA